MTPRGYLSYSQKRMWKSSPRQYIEKYLYNGAQFTTREMAFGKKLAVALEEEKDTDDEVLNGIIARLPKFDKPELEIMVDLKIDKEVVPLYSKLDTAKLDLSAFKDYKTGKTKWNQRKVDEDEQLTFYAMACYLMTGKIPNEISIVWVPTDDDRENPENRIGIQATGEIIEFHTTRSIGQIINEMADCRRVWREINEACEREMI